MYTYKDLPNSKVIVLKRNRLSNAFYRLVIYAFILELYRISFFEHQFQLISVCFEWSIPEIFIMKQSWGDHFASVELCSIYHSTIIVFWRILSISEKDAWIWPVVTVNSWQISWLLFPASVFWKFPWSNLLGINKLFTGH